MAQDRTPASFAALSEDRRASHGALELPSISVFRSKRMSGICPLSETYWSCFLNRMPRGVRKGSDTVGEFAGLAESSTYAGKSARIVASIRTETGSLSFLAQP